MTEMQRKLLSVVKYKFDDLVSTPGNERMYYRCCEELLKIVTQDRGLIPFKPNKNQRRVLDHYFRCKRERKPYRVIINKGRQVGMSTLFVAVLFLEMLGREHFTALVAADKQGKSATNLFHKLVTFIQHSPEFPEEMPFRQRCNRFRGEDKITLHNGSNVRIEGQGDVLSFTNDAVMISEAAHFTDFSDFLGKCLQGTQSIAGSLVIIESTALQYGDGYHKEWQRAVAGESDFEAIFCPWYDDESKVWDMSTLTPEEYREFKDTLGNMDSKYGDEVRLQLDYNLTEAQLMWRRKRISNDCQGSLAIFHREFPCTADEAFMSAENPVFNTQSLVYMRDFICEPTKKGEMLVDHHIGMKFTGSENAEFVESAQGAIEIWKEPSDRCEYIIGSDHAEGTPTGDYNAALVASRRPFEVVAKVRGNAFTKLTQVDFAKQLNYLGRWYYNAEILGESNTQGNAVLNMLDDMNYPNIMRHSQIWPQNGRREYGWLNTATTRKQAIDWLIDALKLNEHADGNLIFDKFYTPVIRDKQTLDELQNMVWKGRGRAEAKLKGERRRIGTEELGYTDDLVFALAGLVMAQKCLSPPRQRDIYCLSGTA